MTQNTTPLEPGFYGLGIAPKLLQILESAKYTSPTPIQFQAIPIAIDGKDVMGIAQTGTGKTLAFAVPMIQRLAQEKGIGLVIAPTRELALQIDETFQKIGRPIGLRSTVLIGGASMEMQRRQLLKKPHVIIATPGRLIDHLDHRSVNLSNVVVLVLDEADRMLDMGFMPQLKQIMMTVPKERQTMLFSATMPGEILNIANTFMQLPVRVEIARAGTMASKVTQELFFVPREGKIPLLQKILGELRGSVLVFSRTKHGATKLARAVRSMGHSSIEIHSNRSLNQRREALDGFKTGKYRVLIATDIAARGIDVKNIEVVLNFDLPDSTDDYVHRIGRTGRAGAAGHAISFATPDQRRDVKDIERLTRTMLPVSKLPDLGNLPPMSMAIDMEDRPRRPMAQSTRRFNGPRSSPGSGRSKPYIGRNGTSSSGGYRGGYQGKGGPRRGGSGGGHTSGSGDSSRPVRVAF